MLQGKREPCTHMMNYIRVKLIRKLTVVINTVKVHRQSN
jgi:hypothetical protein